MNIDHHRINWERFKVSRDRSIRNDQVHDDVGDEGTAASRLRTTNVGREMERALGLEGIARHVDVGPEASRAPSRALVMPGKRRSGRRFRTALAATGFVGMIGAGILAIGAGMDNDFLPALFAPIVQRSTSDNHVVQRLPVPPGTPDLSDATPKLSPAPEHGDLGEAPPGADIANNAVAGSLSAGRPEKQVERPPRSKRTQPEKLAKRPIPSQSAPATRSAAACPPGSTDNACIYQDVLNAHRRVAAAYDDAVSAGVPRKSLVAARRRWDSARSVSLEAPDEAIRRYDRLARDLRNATGLTRQSGSGPAGG